MTRWHSLTSRGIFSFQETDHWKIDHCSNRNCMDQWSIFQWSVFNFPKEKYTSAASTIRAGTLWSLLFRGQCDLGTWPGALLTSTLSAT
jgi:hypothetical protein